jgi:hypothetical protein
MFDHKHRDCSEATNLANIRLAIVMISPLLPRAADLASGARDGYLALNPRDFITSSATSLNGSVPISIYSKPYFLASCSM